MKSFILDGIQYNMNVSYMMGGVVEIDVYDVYEEFVGTVVVDENQEFCNVVVDDESHCVSFWEAHEMDTTELAKLVVVFAS